MYDGKSYATKEEAFEACQKHHDKCIKETREHDAINMG
jgi:hypothetical protein